MGCKAGRCNNTYPIRYFYCDTSLEGWRTKAKDGPSLNEATLTPLDTNHVFQCLRISLAKQVLIEKLYDINKTKMFSLCYEYNV